MKPLNNQTENIEFSLLLEAIYQQYGYDFRDYAPASLRRRILNSLQEEKLNTISQMQDKILHEPDCMERLLSNISINVTSMFRDSAFYVAFRKKVIPLLQDYSFIRIWHAGCATGEEVFSMAILLKEENLCEKIRIYATDIDELALEKAKKGIFPLTNMKEYSNNYLEAGGTNSLSKYYTAKYENAIFQKSLQKNVVWAQHNLATDSTFNEFQIVLCRNVMIYFNKQLQSRVHKLLYESLAFSGLLVLGHKESLKFTTYENCYEAIDTEHKIYKKIV